jgi:fatty acid desaturase
VRLAEDLREARGALALAVAGDPGDPQAHLRQPRRPQPPEDRAYGRAVETWSAISAGLLLILLLGTLYIAVLPFWASPLLAFGAYLAIEAAFRRRLVELALQVTIVLAIAGALVLLVTFLPLVIVALVAGVAILAIVDNVRELRSGR